MCFNVEGIAGLPGRHTRSQEDQVFIAVIEDPVHVHRFDQDGFPGVEDEFNPGGYHGGCTVKDQVGFVGCFVEVGLARFSGRDGDACQAVTVNATGYEPKQFLDDFTAGGVDGLGMVLVFYRFHCCEGDR